jgi:hypothetical protein
MMNVSLLEAKDEFVTLHFNAVPHQFNIVRRERGRFSIQIQKNDLAAMLACGMKCVVEFQDAGKGMMVINDILQNKKWLTLECEMTDEKTIKH